jgi:hypothetical protein
VIGAFGLAAEAVKVSVVVCPGLMDDPDVERLIIGASNGVDEGVGVGVGGGRIGVGVGVGVGMGVGVGVGVGMGGAPGVATTISFEGGLSTALES